MLKNGYSDPYCFQEISDLIDFSTKLNWVGFLALILSIISYFCKTLYYS